MKRAALLVPLALAGCATPAPQGPRPPLVAGAAPPPTLVVPPPTPDWRDEPLTPGDWRYAADADGRPTARYGPPGAPLLLLRCEPATRTLSLVRPGATTGMTIRTSFGEQAAPAGATALELPARAPFWDQLAFSRGRFAVLGAGASTLYVPAWAEPARVVEECRRPTPPVAPPAPPVASPLPAPAPAPTSPLVVNNSERR